jgi:two-component system, OmpR family, response regulator
MDKICVLVVDDEGEFVDALVERLKLRGFDAEGATNGRDALKCMHKRSYNVVLLDVKMPEIGGLEVVRKVKETWPNLQVVLLTGHGSSQDAEEGIQLGAYKYLMKPVNIEDLISILCEASEHKLGEEP